MYRTNIRAPTNINAPEPTGICRRCGFYYHLSELVEQYEWRGPALGKILTRVCVRTCLDEPNEQLRTIIIGPDPTPIFDASPTFYREQNAAPTPIMGGLPPLTDDGSIELIDDDGDIITGG